MISHASLAIEAQDRTAVIVTALIKVLLKGIAYGLLISLPFAYWILFV